MILLIPIINNLQTQQPKFKCLMPTTG